MCLPERRARALFEPLEAGDLGRGHVALGPLKVLGEDLPCAHTHTEGVPRAAGVCAAPLVEEGIWEQARCKRPGMCMRRRSKRAGRLWAVLRTLGFCFSSQRAKRSPGQAKFLSSCPVVGSMHTSRPEQTSIIKSAGFSPLVFLKPSDPR